MHQNKKCQPLQIHCNIYNLLLRSLHNHSQVFNPDNHDFHSTNRCPKVYVSPFCSYFLFLVSYALISFRTLTYVLVYKETQLKPIIGLLRAQVL